MSGERRLTRRRPLRHARRDLARLRREMEMLLGMFPDLRHRDDDRRIMPRTYTPRVVPPPQHRCAARVWHPS